MSIANEVTSGGRRPSAGISGRTSRVRRPVWRRIRDFFAVAAVLGAIARGADGQDPGQSFAPMRPLNPMAVSRSNLYAQPLLPARNGWSHSLMLDYGSAVEWEEARSGARYVLDAELMRIKWSARRDISPSRFLTFGLDLNGIFNGFADGAFDWYHSTIGITFRGREQRPRNEFLYSLRLPKGATVERERPDYFIGDLEVGYGLRHGARNQTLLLATVPTATAPEGYAKDTWSLSAIHTWRALKTDRVLLEGTLGAGYTPAVGELKDVQVRFLNSASSLLAIRLFRSASIYGQLFTQNALYDDTTLPELETREWTGDFGFFGRTASGREWRVGFTEDFGPKDAGIDLIIRFGISWW